MKQWWSWQAENDWISCFSWVAILDVWLFTGPQWGLQWHIYLRYLQEVMWNSHYLHGQKVQLVQSLWVLPNVDLCWNVVGIDEDVVQIYDYYESSCRKMSFINLWKAAGALVSLQALPTTQMNCMGLECSLPLSHGSGYQSSWKFSWGLKNQCKVKETIFLLSKEELVLHVESERDGLTLQQGFSSMTLCRVASSSWDKEVYLNIGQGSALHPEWFEIVGLMVS